MTLILIVLLVALAFEYINGFHDTANSIATVVSTKVLSPRQAVMLSAGTNLFGALWGTAVASTIASGLLDSKVLTLTNETLICALFGAIVWNLITWYVGLPSSSAMPSLVGFAARPWRLRKTIGASSSGRKSTRITGIRTKGSCGKSSCPWWSPRFAD